MSNQDGAFQNKLRRSLTLGQIVETLTRDGTDTRKDVCLCLAEILQLTPAGERKPVEFFVPKTVDNGEYKSKARFGIRGGECEVTVGLRHVASLERWATAQVTVVHHDDSELQLSLADVHIKRAVLERILLANQLPVPAKWIGARAASTAITNNESPNPSKTRREQRTAETQARYADWQARVNEKLLTNEALTHTRACQLVASDLGENTETIRRKVKNPKKKSK